MVHIFLPEYKHISYIYFLSAMHMFRHEAHKLCFLFFFLNWTEKHVTWLTTYTNVFTGSFDAQWEFLLKTSWTDLLWASIMEDFFKWLNMAYAKEYYRKKKRKILTTWITRTWEKPCWRRLNVLLVWYKVFKRHAFKLSVKFPRTLRIHFEVVTVSLPFFTEVHPFLYSEPMA